MDELNYNPFYHYLKNNAKRQYEDAILNQWTVCIPDSRTTNGIQFSAEFVDAHILKTCWENERILVSLTHNKYQKKESTLTLLANKTFSVNIIVENTAYNSEGFQFDIWTIDKPLDPRFQPTDEILKIDSQGITRFSEAVTFFNQIQNSNFDIQSVTNGLIIEGRYTENISSNIQEAIKSCWINLFKLQTIELQRNANFQYLLSKAIENVLVESRYDDIIRNLKSEFYTHDSDFFIKCKTLAEMNATADQFGAPPDYVVPCPAAIVELATLDSRRSPIDKLLCLKITYDLILAELKGAIVDVVSEITDPAMPIITNEAITAMVTYVLVRTKPLHMVTNIFFTRNFQWTLRPKDDTSECLRIFEDAIHGIKMLSVANLLPRNEKIPSALSLEDLIHITSEINSRHGKGISTGLSSVDLHYKRITSMIEAATIQDDV